MQRLYYGVVIHRRIEAGRMNDMVVTFCFLADSEEEALGAAVRDSGKKYSSGDGWTIGFTQVNVIDNDLVKGAAEALGMQG